ncbi:hypothetical protein MMC17_000860 [Xylographa soralifera]|nr:hypothetical protein [Xylographa soralifera]
MRFSTIAVLLTATFAGLGVALPGEEPFNNVPRSQPDRVPPPRPPRPAPLYPPAPPLTDSYAHAHHRKRAPRGNFNLAARSQPDRVPRPLPPSPGPPPDRPLPPIPRPLPDHVNSHHHKREPEPEFDFELYARDFGVDVAELYERGLGGDLEIDERDLDEALELYERGFGEDFELDE